MPRPKSASSVAMAAQDERNARKSRPWWISRGMLAMASMLGQGHQEERRMLADPVGHVRHVEERRHRRRRVADDEEDDGRPDPAADLAPAARPRSS